MDSRKGIGLAILVAVVASFAVAGTGTAIAADAAADGDTAEISVDPLAGEDTASINVTELSAESDAVAVGDSVAVTATVENNGATTATRTLSFTSGGEVVATRTVSLAPNEGTTVSVSHTVDSTDDQSITVGDRTVTVTGIETVAADSDRVTAVLVDAAAQGPMGTRALGSDIVADVRTDERVQFAVNVSNPTGERLAVRLPMTSDGSTALDSTLVELDAGESRVVTVEHRFERADSHAVALGDDSAAFRAVDPARTVTVRRGGDKNAGQSPAMVYDIQTLVFAGEANETVALFDDGARIAAYTTGEDGRVTVDPSGLEAGLYRVEFGDNETAAQRLRVRKLEQEPVSLAVETEGTVHLTFPRPVETGSVTLDAWTPGLELDDRIGDDDGDRELTVELGRDVSGIYPVGMNVSGRWADDGSRFEQTNARAFTGTTTIDPEGPSSPEDAVVVPQNTFIMIAGGSNATATIETVDGSVESELAFGRTPATEKYTAKYEPGQTYAVTFGAGPDTTTTYFRVAESTPSVAASNVAVDGDTVRATVVRSGSTERIVVELSDGADTRYTSVTTGEGESAVATFGDVPAGEYTLTVQDTVSSRAQDETSVSVTAPAPDVSVTHATVANDTVTAGSPVRVTATLVNDGGAKGSVPVALSANGSPVATTNVTVPADGRSSVTLSHTFEDAGVYTLAVNDTGAGTLTVEAPRPVEPIDGTLPTDPDGDGEYEDLDGDGEITDTDVEVFFQHMDDDVLRNHIDAYDFSGNGDIDNVDVVELRREAERTDGPSVERIDGVLPTDPDGDGEFEDLDGDGEVTKDDATVYFQHMRDEVMTDHVEAYDYNDNGGISNADLILLHNGEA